jgi:signal transduction histidine kinase
VSGTASILGRLLRTQLLWSLLWVAVLGTAVSLAVQHEVDELLDDSLQTVAENLIAPLLNPAVLPTAINEPAPLPAGQKGADSRFVWQLVAEGTPRKVVARAAGAPAQPLRATPSGGFGDVPGWRVYGLALGHDGHMLYVAQSRGERNEAKLELMLVASLAAAPMVLLGLLWLNARVRHELQPLQDLSRRLVDFDPLRPGARLDVADRIELRPVQDAIEALAARLSRRVAHERAFTAHAAHALRTPLAGIDAQLAVALREAPAALQPRLQRVRLAAGRLQRVVAALLALFRSGAEVQREPLDLAALAARLPVEGLVLRAVPGPPLRGDVDLVSAALLNLLDNALRHGASEVTLDAPAAGVLRVRDNGPGVDTERRSALKQALHDQRYEGPMGLGLMLADLVARAHGGTLQLPDTDTGFCAELHLGTATGG